MNWHIEYIVIGIRTALFLLQNGGVDLIRGDTTNFWFLPVFSSATLGQRDLTKEGNDALAY